MALYPFKLYCQRVDASRNLARYYMLSIETTLFGEAAVVRAWGRIGSRGGEKRDVFSTERDAASHFLELVRRKRQRGYTPVGTCGNSMNA
ncbi:WGR domain-containing protein [Phyllobacterium zundukense]|uniref:WGR domain-containing protein n=1 Tax=Phyllobacterium zundukense TaxID=1867719 RepID=A0ACD4CVY6_9HYPH|nr:WGR domain-containing protein [Phyllobacterium zundukense]UXN57757.1 WGR domain-containing protein [Phyllobacterium zundukense]